MPLKNVGIVAAVCVLVGWLLASTLAPPVARVQSLPQQPQPRAAAPVEQFTERIQLRRAEARPAPENRRNPFAFATRGRTTIEAPPAAAVPAPSFAEPMPIPTGPTYVLSGMGISGEVRTAVLTDGDDVLIVKVNDVVGGFTVAEIGEDGVTLVRNAERHILRFVQ
jgi:hypothetical protein